MRNSNMSDKQHRIFQIFLLIGAYSIALISAGLIFIASDSASKYNAVLGWFSLWFLAPAFICLSHPNGREASPTSYKYAWIGGLALCYISLGLVGFLIYQ
ncbi:MAG: hypothetical protein KF836_08775 [Fimbriimonadaceae bacterium]|nr:hypothetical protein [Fimbriimonadaceae bacterium]